MLALRGCDLVLCPAALRGALTSAHAGTAISQNYPIPTGADPHHWHLMRARGRRETMSHLAFANVLDEAAGYGGKSGVFGPDTFEFPRREAILSGGEGVAVAEIDTSNLDTALTRPMWCGGRIGDDAPAASLPHAHRLNTASSSTSHAAAPARRGLRAS